jgi:hypothetical protein
MDNLPVLTTIVEELQFNLVVFFQVATEFLPAMRNHRQAQYKLALRNANRFTNETYLT